jgi:hypothetical protein
MYPFKRMSKKIIGTLLISSHPKALSAKISDHANTTLHIAVLAAHINIVKELVNKMSKENLKLKNNKYIWLYGPK